MSKGPKRWSHQHHNDQTLPRMEHPEVPKSLLDCDFSEIELRVAAQMKDAFGVPDKMLRHGLNHSGTVTGRWSGSKPQFREMPKTSKD